MAKRSKKVVSANNMPRKRSGGRRPGAWTLVTPEALRTFRSENKLSRARLASMLGVSSTSVQNWETGAVASLKVQQRLAELVQTGAVSATPAPRQEPAALGGAQKGSSDTAVSATAAIVGPYAGAQKDLSPQALLELVRSVRQALS